MLTKGKSQPLERPKRFYRSAEPGELDGVHTVLLDGRPVRTPAGARLSLPSLALARLVAEEWAAQEEFVDLAAMLATRLAYTAQDRAEAAREGVADEIARYGGSDVLCYFADGPEGLVQRELQQWGALLDWAEAELGVRLERVTGIIHRAQPQAATDRIRALALEQDPFTLTALANLSGLLGSAVLAFAVQRGRLGAVEAYELSRLDEAFQEERWGVDEEAEARNAHRRQEAAQLERWLRSLKDGDCA